MTQGNVATSTGASRREVILREAAKLFAARGFHGVGVDDIGAAAGITGPGIYRHFTSKDAMLAEMLIGISRRLLDGGSLRARAARDSSAALDALIDWHVDFALNNPELIVVHDRDLDTLPDDPRHEVKALQRRYVELWADVIRETAPDISVDEARAAAHAVFGLLNSTPHSASVLERHLMATLLHRMARGALSAHGG
jgi:AcrR family transcriptional regulator